MEGFTIVPCEMGTETYYNQQKKKRKESYYIQTITYPEEMTANHSKHKQHHQLDNDYI